ncbi:hypothetical protein CQW23_09006 [Capsicum baccatum]|uniref:Uncharacterized protein n=1 Tax=Capsicum baccatum TaxID=33114 RepID=A0A2G2XAL0_CAPBA|nr:hypothetical protein CQW23_09006 [Capsicum baccatum]
MDIKQLQADLAATVKGNDILKCEVQNALDALSYATPKLKYLELQDNVGSLLESAMGHYSCQRLDRVCLTYLDITTSIQVTSRTLRTLIYNKSFVAN